VISKISVRGVDTASGDSAFGFVADKIGKYSRVDGPSILQPHRAGHQGCSRELPIADPVKNCPRLI
jgi:hypothetical protein